MQYIIKKAVVTAFLIHCERTETNDTAGQRGSAARFCEEGTMKRIVRACEMKECDSRMIRDIGVPSLVLMERAASDTAAEIRKRIQKPIHELRVLCVCGSGNNGGDGFACARIFQIKGAKADILFVGNPDHMTEETARQREICRRLAIPERDKDKITFDDYDVIIDAIFGIGLSRDISGSYLDVIRSINAAKQAFVASVDIPSGIHADTGAVMGDAVSADLTVTMEFMKPGLILYPGAMYAGEVIDAEIGIEAIPSETAISLPEEIDLKAALPKRMPYGNKGTFGKLLVIAGSYNMCGAAYFASKSALVSGAGMVKLLTVEENRQIIQETLPEVMLSTYTEAEDAIAHLSADLAWCDGVVCGSGMGQTKRTEEIVTFLLTHCDKPLILDADALNVISGQTERLSEHKGELILTPHMGEMSRLSKKSIGELKQDPIAAALQFAKEHHVTLVMKDARTVTAYPDGRSSLNCYGNSGMATAGSGDVLAGIVGSLTVQGAKAAPETAVLLHALAGDAARDTHGEACLTATDLIEGIKTIYKRL